MPLLAKSMCIAARLGSSALPAAAEAYKTGGDTGTPFTIINNRGAVALGQSEL